MKDTPSSGQHGKGDLCYLYTLAGLAAAPPHYATDPNFDCGSRSALQPGPPAGGAAAAAAACVTIIATNGSASRFCADKAQTATTCTAAAAAATGGSAGDVGSAGWRLRLAGVGVVVVTLEGNMAVADSAGARSNSNSSALAWTLLSAWSDQIEVRAVDLGFGFVGVSGKGDGYYYTQSSKKWAAPNTSAMEWAVHTHGGVVGRPEAAVGRAPPRVRFDANWSPPLPLPWTARALADPSRGGGGIRPRGGPAAAWRGQDGRDPNQRGQGVRLPAQRHRGWGAAAALDGAGVVGGQADRRDDDHAVGPRGRSPKGDGAGAGA